ncbi:MAG: Rpn family recombination-promoting nuclease/putative transposase, partial [Planctomycetota bacterium]
ASLPPAIARAIDWSTLRRVDGQYADKALEERRSDMLFEAQLAGELVLIQVLTELKSSDEAGTPLQVAGYSVRLLERWRAEHPGQPLPPVLPFVLYHGPRPWRSPRSVGESFAWRAFPDELAAFLRPLQFEQRFLLLDLGAMDEAALDALRLSAMAALTLRFLQFLRWATPDQVAVDLLRWAHFVHAVHEHPRGKDVLQALFSWWLGRAPANPENFRVVMTKFQQEDPAMRSLLDMVLDLGEERGVQKGMQQGMLNGRRTLVAEQLAARFGELPAAIGERLQSADAESLQRWGRRLLTAPTLAAVFEGN